MFREMRRKDRLLSIEETRKLLIEGEYGVLATVGEDAYPYATTLNYVYYNDSIYFHSAQIGKKIDNINYNKNVSFTVVGNSTVIPDEFTTKYTSVVVFGTAFTVDGEEKRNALEAIINKYAPNHKEQGMPYIEKMQSKTTVIKIIVKDMSGKGNI